MTASADAPLLEARGAARSYRLPSGLFERSKTLWALDDVSISLFPGEILGLVGESGSGKSTLARLLMRIEAPSRGDVRFGGQAIGRIGRRFLGRRIQIMFQDSRRALDPRIPCLTQVIEPLVIHRLGTRQSRKERAETLLIALGLAPHLFDRFPHQLSGGQCQRVALARAMILEPDALICDEPTSAADVSVQAQVVKLLLELRAQTGVAILFISHNLGLVRHVCDRVAVMYLGRIVEVAPAGALLAAPRHPYTRTLVDAVPRITPRRGQPLPVMAGEPPSPVLRPSGCAFHPRCPRAEARCRNERPEISDEAGRHGHAVACHFPLEPGSGEAVA